MAKASDYLIAIDDGHGPQTAGKRTPYIASLGRQIQENEFNKPVVNYLEAELKRCGFRTLQLAPTDLDTPLTTRTNTANRAKANALISVHFNAMGNTFEYSSAKGFSAHIQEGLSNNSDSYKLAKLIVKELSKGTPQVNRGIVKQNLAITRQSAMPAVLVEAGFMDDPAEAMLMINKSFQQEVAMELAKAVCRFFGVSYLANNKEGSVTVSAPKVNDRNYLMEGDSGPAVGQLQKDLNQAGANPQLVIDNRFGIAVKNRVITFQKQNGLEADGIYGAASVAKMKAVLGQLAKASAKKEEAKVTKPREVSKHHAVAWDWAKKQGYLNGEKPGEPLSREQFATVLKRVEEEKEKVHLSDAQRKEYSAIFKLAREKGIFESAEHEQSILDGTMKKSRLEYLQLVIAAAALNGGMRV